MLTPRIPRLTASRHGFLARSTALSWPWNKDRILAPPGTMPPSFTDLTLGLVDRSKPVIQVWCKDPLQREDDAGASPVVPAQAGTQGATTHAAAEPEALDPRFREDDDEDLGSAQNPLQREHAPQLPLRPAGGGEGRGEVGNTPAADAHMSHSHTRTTMTNDPLQRERTGPLRNGNPRGNPNLAPRCGARTRRTGCPCRAPAMRNGRCRLHGGKSTGPRSEEGRARIRAARTRHGLYTAESRAFQRDISGLLRRNRELLSLASQPGPVDTEALHHLLPPNFAKHPMQREAAATRAQMAWQNPVQREEPRSPPARHATSVAASPAPAIPQPILLARPIPLAP